MIRYSQTDANQRILLNMRRYTSTFMNVQIRPILSDETIGTMSFFFFFFFFFFHCIKPCGAMY